MLCPRCPAGSLRCMAGLTMVPNVAQGPPPQRGPRTTKRIFLGYLIVMYIGNQIMDIYAIRYHTSTVHGLLGILLHIYKCMAFYTFRL